MLPHPIANFEIQKYYQNEPKFDDVYAINNLPKQRMDVCHKFSIGTHSIALYVNVNNKRASYDAIYFDIFGVENIPKQIEKFIGNKNIIKNIHRI